MINPILTEYIKAGRDAGMSQEQMIEALIQAGWHMADIMPVFGGLNTSIHRGQTAISVQNVQKSFGSVQALRDINISVPYGKVYGLLGPNGAGKTTLVRILTTLLKQDQGQAAVAGYDLQHQADEVRSVVGLTGQNTAIDDHLTGRENLELVGRLYHFKSRDLKARAQELLEKFELTDAADRPTKTYSGGMRRRLDLAMSLFNRPRVLFLDEPTTGLDPQSRIALWHIIKELLAEGTTVLLTTQYLEEADHLADMIIVINHGQIIAQGTPDELKSKIGGDVLEVHLAKTSDVQRVAQILKPLSSEQPHVEEELGMVAVPAVKGSASLIEAVRLLDSERVIIADIALRRPTLDDVFLTLTGHKEKIASSENFFSTR